jgi:propanol-preferring alcohol dehydrogenase
MKAQVLYENVPVEKKPLKLVELPVPQPNAHEILVEVSACGVCHTELDEIEGRLHPKLPIVLGHEIIGTVASLGTKTTKFRIGDRVGIAWINAACGDCYFCKTDRENLCNNFKSTGCDAAGGYAEYTTVDENFAYSIPDVFTDVAAAPLLCAGAIGYRDLLLSGIRPGNTLGLFGFGASAHIVLQLARYHGFQVYVFTRGEDHMQLARELGAVWVGKPEDNPPQNVDCAIDFTPVGETVSRALEVIGKGGRLMIAVIRKRTPIPPMDYARLLWHEKEIKSVANITRRDVVEFLPLAAKIPIISEVREFNLEEANDALVLLKQGKIRGAAVLRI